MPDRLESKTPPRRPAERRRAERRTASPSPNGHQHRHPRARARARRFLITYLVVLLVVGVLRMSLPTLLERYVNDVLGEINGHRVSLRDVDINLWRGAYEVEDLRIVRSEDPDGAPVLELPRLDLSISWSELLHGHLVSDAVLHRPTMRLMATAKEDDPVERVDRSWLEGLYHLTPFRIDRIVVRDAELRYFDTTIEPRVDLYATDVYIEARNLTNIQSAGAGPLYAEIEAAGRPLGDGEAELRVRLDPMAELPEFELDFALRKIELVELNDWLQAYGRVDAEDGTLEAFGEFAAREGRIEGYVKPVFEGVRVFSFDEIDDPGDALEALWEGFVALGAELLENQPHDRLAMRLPLEGEWGAASGDVWDALASVLRNAFVAALRPAIDDSIELEDLRPARRRSNS
jgi:hypothetical protein